LYYVIASVAVVVIVGIILLFFVSAGPPPSHGSATLQPSSSTTTRPVSLSTSRGAKPVILYVNQGNGIVNQSNFSDLLYTANSGGFNTIFFQVYRSGVLLFSTGSLEQFVASAHADDLEIFFALYFTNSTQTIPTSAYSDGEDGIDLDMSTLPLATQTSLFAQLSSSYSGKTAITTDDFALSLKPDLLVFETYSTADQQYIRPGIIAGVEVSPGETAQQYHQQFQYALSNSNGVMVFDYDHLVKYGL
jgi:hypothetical protein